MRSRTKAAILGAVLIVGAGGYLFATRDPSSSEPAAAGSAGTRSTGRDGAVRRALLERAARGPDALASFHDAWGDAEGNTAKEQLLVEAARLGVPGWLAEVASSDDTLAARAGAALGTIVDPRAGSELAQLAVATDGAVIVRANAARALGTAGGAEHVPVLAGLVTDPSTPLRVRQEAALSLGRLRNPGALKDLASTLDAARSEVGPNGEQLRISLIQALESLGTKDARAVLASYARSSPSATEAAFLQRALARSR